MLAALNIAHELLESRRNQERNDQAISQRIRGLREKIELALNAEVPS